MPAEKLADYENVRIRSMIAPSRLVKNSDKILIVTMQNLVLGVKVNQRATLIPIEDLRKREVFG